jgi:hypothetical protein
MEPPKWQQPNEIISVGTKVPRRTLILRRANISRKGGPWQQEDYDVFDGDQDVGRIYPGAVQAGSVIFGMAVSPIAALKGSFWRKLQDIRRKRSGTS